MASEFRQYIHAEIESMVRDIGDELITEPDRLNAEAIEWIRKNAARFREEWRRRRRDTHRGSRVGA